MQNNLFSISGLSLERLATFVKISDAGGIGAASNGDANRQSQYSRQLKELEEFFGQGIARRGRGRFELTQFGRELYRLSSLHLRAITEMRARIGSNTIELRFGAGESVLKWLILPQLSELRKALPNTVWSFENRTSADCFDRLSNGSLDLAIVNESRKSRSIVTRPIGEMEIVVATSVPLPKSWKAKDLPRLLANLPLILLEGSSLAEQLLEEAKRQKIQLTVAAFCTSYGQVTEALSATEGAGFVPRLASGTASLGKYFFTKLPMSIARRSLSLAYSPGAAKVRTDIDRAFKSLLPFLSAVLKQTSGDVI